MPANPRETLLLVSISNAYGVITIQSVWATTADIQRGHRRTDVESVTTHVALLHRLAELGRAMQDIEPQIVVPDSLGLAASAVLSDLESDHDIPSNSAPLNNLARSEAECRYLEGCARISSTNAAIK